MNIDQVVSTDLYYKVLSRLNNFTINKIYYNFNEIFINAKDKLLKNSNRSYKKFDNNIRNLRKKYNSHVLLNKKKTLILNSLPDQEEIKKIKKKNSLYMKKKIKLERALKVLRRTKKYNFQLQEKFDRISI